MIAFHDRPQGAPEGRWERVCGPEETGAALIIRNEVHLYDVHLHDRQQVDVPAVEGLTPFLYVIDGLVGIGGDRLGSGDAASDADRALPPVRALADTSLVRFLVDPNATGSKAGTISGH